MDTTELDREANRLISWTLVFADKAAAAIADIRAALQKPELPAGFRSKREYAMFIWRDVECEFNEPKGAMQGVRRVFEALADR